MVYAGKVKQTVYDLPGEHHTYGKKVVDDPEPIKHGILVLRQLCTAGKMLILLINLPPNLKISRNLIARLLTAMSIPPRYLSF